MKRSNVLQSLAVLFVFALLVWGLVPSVSEGAVPQLINFQGILKDGSGNPVADGSYSVTFTIYDAASGGNNLWTETQSVTTAGGLFAVLLGSSNPVPDTVFKGTDRWLGIAVSPDGEMPQRQKMVSVGYSYRVNSVDSAAGGTINSKVSIGPGHTNSGADAFVAGKNNRARGAYSVVGGGGGSVLAADSNAALGDYSVVGGGRGNVASGNVSAVRGGQYNKASGFYAAVGGGTTNTAGAEATTVGGGRRNSASAGWATVSGGNEDTASGLFATVGGGGTNLASGDYATVPGGAFNVAAGAYSFAGGLRAEADHDGSFVWSDLTSPGGFASTAANQFLIQASGGVGIGTTSPSSRLHVLTPFGQSSDVFLENAGGSLLKLAGEASAASIGTQNDFPLYILQNNFSRISVTPGGNVGIGTPNPSSKLDVSDGDILLSNSRVLRAVRAAGGADGAVIGTNGFDRVIVGESPLWGAVTFSPGGLEKARITSSGSVGIGTTSPGASNLLELSSTTKGFVLPRMTKTERDAIASPVAGMMIYQTDNTPGLRVYNGTNWMRFTETAD